jgi:multiple sugar transport system ATP-binding protein
VNAPVRPAAALSGGLAIRAVGKSFKQRVLDDVSLDVAQGEILALTGPSGAGKTTLARIAAGLERPDAGRVFFGGTDATAIPAGRRRVAFLFESYALYPHLSVRQNALSPLMAPHVLGLEGGRMEPGAMQARVDEVLGLLEIRHLDQRLPGALSGGQKQRVALARTLVQTPSLFVLDEPISHLDAKLRHKLRGEIRRRLSAQGAPTIWATPDGMEALSVGDRVAVIDHGRIEQVGTPEDIWLRPSSIRVARLMGDPPMNLIDGTLHHDGDRILFTRRDLAMPLPEALWPAAKRAKSAEAVLGVRPNALRLVPAGSPGAAPAEIYSNEPFGKHAVVTIDLGGLLAKLKTSVAAAQFPGTDGGAGIGQAVHVGLPSEGLILFDKATGRTVQA